MESLGGRAFLSQLVQSVPGTVWAFASPHPAGGAASILMPTRDRRAPRKRWAKSGMRRVGGRDAGRGRGWGVRRTRVSWQGESPFHPESTLSLSPLWKSSLVRFLDGEEDEPNPSVMFTRVTEVRIAVVFVRSDCKGL